MRRGGALPDGPASAPLRQGTWFHRDPLGMTRAMHARYGDVLTPWPTPERMVVRGTVLVPHRSELVLAQEV